MRNKTIQDELRRRVLVLDGAMGTAIQAASLTADDFGGADFEGCNEYLNLRQPDLIAAILQRYLDAGADIIETNTFGATALVLSEYGLQEKAREINLAAARLARDLADSAGTAAQPRFVAGSMGPTTKAISVTGGVTFAELTAEFQAQAAALIEGGVDYLLLETCQDTRNVKAGLLGIDAACAALGRAVPVAVSATIEPMGTMLAGQGVEALYASLNHTELLYLGLNCATGPDFMTDHIRSLAQLSTFPVSCVPNAGLPDEDGNYLETPDAMALVLDRFGKHGWVNLIGGCCGTTDRHVARFAELAAAIEPRQIAPRPVSILSGIDFLEVNDNNRPVIIGERTNVIGSRKFKRLICEEKYEEAAEIARRQVKSGAQIIDVCLANPDRDEARDMAAFLEQVIRKVKVPLMIDSTDEEVLPPALSYCQGKAMINSINLEDGRERFDKVVPIAMKYGAALVVGCIDDNPEQGMAITRERKLAVAERSHRILIEDFGFNECDIYFDPLTFPCATGDENYIGSARETIEGVRLIKERFPHCRTVLGISNVSFGLPPAGREILNSVFLYHCVRAGLDTAIVNSQKLERFTHISADDLKLAEDLLFNRGSDPVAVFADRFRDRKPKDPVDKTKVPLDERLQNYIIEGSKDGLVEDLDAKLKETTPLEIINGPLMQGMDTVGKLFNENKLIVAEVLQSAEAMKAAVAHLEQFMEKKDSASRGKVLLATVKGDVHDIGKNLVEIIFGNNGFEIINLGIRVPPAALIAAAREHQPDIIGLSGLLVKSAQMMLNTAEQFSADEIDVPLLCGGAALTANYVNNRINPAYSGDAFYAPNAMAGLDLAKQIVDPESRLETPPPKSKTDKTGIPERITGKQPAPAGRPADLDVVASPPAPPDFDRHVLRHTAIEEIWRYVDPLMLWRHHLGMKRPEFKLLQQAIGNDRKLAALRESHPGIYRTWEAVEAVKQEFGKTQYLQPAAVYRFCRCASEGQALHLYADRQRSDPIATFHFQRQTKAPGLCLADYVNPTGGAPDNLCLMVTSVGRDAATKAEELKQQGEYLRSVALLTMAIRTAEAYAEYLHAQFRRMWGIQDEDLAMADILKAKYKGCRYSFGYPACPNLDDQAKLWDLLQPEEIGCELTEEMMMVPESSVSALVFHHPQAVYFSVK